MRTAPSPVTFPVASACSEDNATNVIAARFVDLVGLAQLEGGHQRAHIGQIALDQLDPWELGRENAALGLFLPRDRAVDPEALSMSSSVRYMPSWPVMPVTRARFWRSGIRAWRLGACG